MYSLWLAFITGLTTGGISCVAIQGGVITSAVSTNQKKPRHIKNSTYISLFLMGKLIGNTAMGFILGLMGSFFAVSLPAQGFIQILVALFMFATVGRILEIHPIFQYVALQPPKAFFKFIKGLHRSNQAYVTPFLTGALLVALPCGVTQIMLASTIASGNPVMGALIMAAYTLGTSPLFFALGFAASQFLQHKIFSYVTAGIVLYFGITALNGGLTLLGSPYTLQNFYKAATMNSFSSPGTIASIGADGKQAVTILITSHAYSSNASVLKKDVPVKLSLITQEAQGCLQAFTIPSLNMTKYLPATGSDIVEFTPKTTGKLVYSCNAGIYTGEFTVIL